MTDAAPLTIRREGPVVRAIMDRPERRNALTEAMGAAWDSLLAELAQDRGVRVLVIGGAGGHFCAGLDLTEVASSETPEQKLARQQARNRRTGARFIDISTLPQVVIATV
ncbi:MAG: enoyl-CoA hydratase/isomerase family protein, partial [Acetobacteraceae bacterium]|nr:enoyl-CoA hydratase/isomerase family protein [Acetobacteraceae bacterium]